MTEIDEVYDGKSGGAYNSARYLAAAIGNKGKDLLDAGYNINDGINIEPLPHQRGGCIVFSTDVTNIDTIAADNALIGWSIGHYLDGRYTATNGKRYGENSLSVEIIGVDLDNLIKIATELCNSFTQESVLVKDYSSGRVLFLKNQVSNVEERYYQEKINRM